MTTGPSKEELQDYWNNNRQYFDELAKYYLQSDREYYTKFIAPFYSNPLIRSSPKTGGGAGKLLIIIAAVIVVITAGAVAFMVLMPESQDTVENKKTISPKVVQDSVIKHIIHSDNKSADNINDTTETIPQPPPSPDYDKGLSYFHNKDYDNAEKCFKRVPKGDKNYTQALKKLMDIKIIRGEDINEVSPEKPKDDNRKKPLERTR